MTRALALSSLAAALAACAGAPPADPAAAHRDALAASVAAAAGAPAPGSPAQKAAVERFVRFISDLSTATVRADIRSVYAPEFYFNDTLKTVRTVDELERYFLATDEALASYALTVEEAAPTPEGVYLRWRMDVSYRRLRKGEVSSSIGVSHIRFDKDGRVVYHQDYWDPASALFEKIPVLGAGIRAVKRRL